MTGSQVPFDPGERLLLAAPLLAGALLRFYGMGSQGLCLDEAFSIDLARRPWGELFKLAAQDVHPFLYYVLLKPVLQVLPVSEWGARSLSALCSTLALVLAVAITRRLAGTRAAAIAGCLLAWSSLQLYYAQETRMYTLLELLWLLAPWLLLQALDHTPPVSSGARPGIWLHKGSGGVWRWWLGWALTTAAAIHTQFFGLLLWGIGALLGLVMLLRGGQRLGPWLAAQGLIAAATVPLLTLVFSTVARGVGGTWVPGPLDLVYLATLALFGFGATPFLFLNSDLLALAPLRELSTTAWGGLALIVTLVGLLGWWRGPSRNQGAWLSLGFGLGPVLLAYCILRISGQPLWGPRLFIGAVAWLLIGLAIGLAALPRLGHLSVLATLLAFNAGSLWAYETQWVKDYGRAAALSWQAQVPPGSLLVLDRPATVLIWRFYLDGLGSRFPLLALAPQPDGSIVLRRLHDDGTMRGYGKEADCADLQNSATISLYDPSGRAAHEPWPVCLYDRPVWRFNRVTLRWER